MSAAKKMFDHHFAGFGALMNEVDDEVAPNWEDSSTVAAFQYLLRILLVYAGYNNHEIPNLRQSVKGFTKQLFLLMTAANVTKLPGLNSEEVNAVKMTAEDATVSLPFSFHTLLCFL